MADIFISYRREDSAGHAGRLYDNLVTRFEGANVFIDVDSIKPGVDFVKHMQDAVSRCDVLLVIIGDEWAHIRDRSGARRLDDPEDFVRVEVAAALERHVPVLPVLIEGAQMPDPEELPEDIRPLARHNAIDLSDARWRFDVTRLEAAIKDLAPATGEVPAVEPPPTKQGPPWKVIGAAVAGVAVIAVALALVLGGGGDDDAATEQSSAASAQQAASLSANRRCASIEEPEPARVLANANTSCPFALNVAQAALDEAQSGQGGFDVTAFSPATGETITMACVAEGLAIECTGGRDAAVRILREEG